MGDSSVQLERRYKDEKLASQLAAFGLLGRNNISSGTKQAVHSSSSSSNPIYPHGLRRSYSNGGVRPCSVKPIHLEAERFRGWVYQTEPGTGRVRFIPAHQTGSDVLTTQTGFFGRETDRCPFIPVRSRVPSWFYPRTGVFEGEPRLVRFVPVRTGIKSGSGGTGVFLPRLAVKDEVNRKNYMKQKKPLKQNQEVVSTKVDGTEQKGPTCQSDADMDIELPHEWSY